MVGGLLGLLIFLVILFLIAALLWYIVDLLPIPASPFPIKVILKILILVICIVAIIQKTGVLAGVS